MVGGRVTCQGRRSAATTRVRVRARVRARVRVMVRAGVRVGVGLGQGLAPRSCSHDLRGG